MYTTMARPMSPNSQQLFLGLNASAPAPTKGFTVVFSDQVRYERKLCPTTGRMITNYSNMLPPPRRTFQTEEEYMRWREKQFKPVNEDSNLTDEILHDEFIEQQAQQSEMQFASAFER